MIDSPGLGTAQSLRLVNNQVDVIRSLEQIVISTESDCVARVNPPLDAGALRSPANKHM